MGVCGSTFSLSSLVEVTGEFIDNWKKAKVGGHRWVSRPSPEAYTGAGAKRDDHVAQAILAQDLHACSSSTLPLLFMAVPFRRGDVVFLRLNLHPAEAGSPVLHRGDAGEVCDVRGSDGTVKVRFRATCVRCRPEWLECSPGTICLGINAMLTKRYPFYSTGMMVSDLCFPTEIHECFGRMQRNWNLLHQSGLGFSFFDGVDASCSRWKLTNCYGWSHDELNKRIGLILCEEIWPWDRRRWPIVADFHKSIARALMTQWGNATCVMVLRSSDAQRLQRSLGYVQRISYHWQEIQCARLKVAGRCQVRQELSNQ